MKQIKIIDWDQFQHYKGNTSGMPSWIKLYTNILENYRFATLKDSEKLLLILLWVLASRVRNEIPYDFTWIKNSIRVDFDPAKNIKHLIDLGFVEIIDCPGLKNVGTALDRSEGTALDRSINTDLCQKREEEIREEKKREEENGVRPPDHSIIKINVTDISESLATPEFVEAWEKFLKHRKEIGKPLKATGQSAALEKLSKFGPVIAEQSIIESISNGWQGLFPEKIQAAKQSSQPSSQQTNQHFNGKTKTPLVDAMRSARPSNWDEICDRLEQQGRERREQHDKGH